MKNTNPLHSNRCFIFIFLFASVFIICGQVLAKEALKGPKYHNLRYDEDFSYLVGPEDSYIKDVWDPIKLISLGDEWHLTVGGQARLRFESETDKDFGASSPSHDSFLLQRYFIHTDFRHISGMRIFVQGKFAYSAR